MDTRVGVNVYIIIVRAGVVGQIATTIRQVAAAAGVSIATASRALSGSDAVVDATKSRVLQVAADLDYTPSRLARSLVTGTTGNVGVIVPDITNPFYAPFLAELESTLAASDVGLLIGNSQESSEREHLLVRRMSTQVDGLVLASSRMSDEQVVRATGRLPVVLVNRRLGPGVEVPIPLAQVVIDVAPGFGAALRHLYGLGHRRLRYIDGPVRSWSAAQKRDALQRSCAELGMALEILGTVRPDFPAGREVGRRIVGDRSTQPGGAVLAYNDQVALGVLSACRDAGVRVPGQLSVVGCDDSLPEGLAEPALTTVDSSSRDLGARSAAAILDPAGIPTDTVTTRLVIRASTGPAAPTSAQPPGPSRH